MGLVPALAIGTAYSSSASPAPTTVITAPGSGLHKLDAVLRAESLHLTRTKPIDLFVKSADTKRTRADIVRLGGSVGTISGDILTARIPRRALAELSDDAQVQRLEASGRKSKRLEKLLPEMKVDQLHGGVGGTTFKGKGVVVGIVDGGLDLTHAAFKTTTGASRVIAAWDQVATTGTKPANFDYGKECTKAQLAANDCTLPATEMHGTHVTGIAAGSKVGEYSGVAPEADIVFVNTDGGDTQICDAAKYIFAIAAAEGKPAVVNMSLGGHAGPHDGTALEDECLDNLVGPGKIIVAAAGNEGEGAKSTVTGTPNVSVHAQLTAAAAPKSVRFLPSVKDDAVSLNAYAYFDAPSAVSIRVGAVVGNGAPVFTNVMAVGDDPIDGVSLTVGAHTLGPISITNASFPSGARQFTIEIGDDNNDKSELEDVQWILEATGTGKLDAYIDTSNTGGFLSTNASAGVTVDNQQTIGNPAIAKNVLAVASYVTRNAWMPADTSLGAQTQPGAVLGARSGFSSQGPARRTTVITGPKPDIAAPGELIASALSVGATEEEPEKIVKAAPNAYILEQGTSMASPAVAGAIALMLQTKPTLTVAQIRTALDTTSTLPNGGTATQWGRGKLNALAAVESVAGLDGGTSSSSSSSSSSSGTPEPNTSTSSSSGTPNDAAPASDDSGCSATTHASSPSLAVPSAFAALAMALAFSRRSRKRD